MSSRFDPHPGLADRIIITDDSGFCDRPAPMVAFRTLALLAIHPEQRERALGEQAKARPEPLPYLRGCVLESARLWPTTPALLRQSVRPTTWGGSEAPADTTFLIHAPFFHRDATKRSNAHRLTPSIWLDSTADDDAGLMPFSADPASCPGQNLVLMMTSQLLADVLRRAEVAVNEPTRIALGRLPETLDQSMPVVMPDEKGSESSSGSGRFGKTADAPGAELTFTPKADYAEIGTAVGRVMRAEPPRVLEYLWGAESLRWALEPAGEGATRLTFTNVFDDRDFAAANGAGWHAGLARLADHLAGRDPHDSLLETDESTWHDLVTRYERSLD